MTDRLTLIVTCEHGGNAVPKAYHRLFEGHRRILQSHRGYDPGALDVARYLARRFSGPLHYATHTRLLVELNRSLHHRDLFSEVTRPLDREKQTKIVERHYKPHRSGVEIEIRRALSRGRVVLHLASHTFTPELDGKRRTADVAWLYDPKREPERRFVARWKSELGSFRPDLRLRRNYPYRGAANGFTTHLRRLFGRGRYLGIELEINQALFFGNRLGWKRLREGLGDSLEVALAHSGRKR